MKCLNRAEWLTDKFIYVMLGLFPLYVGQGYTNISAPRALFFYIATGLWTLALLALWLLAALRREEFTPRVKPVHMAVMMFLLLAAVSSLLSPLWKYTLLGASSVSGKPRWDGLVTLLGYGAIFFGVSFFARPKRSYIWVMAGAAVLCCLVAVVQLLGFDIFGLYPEGTNYYDKYAAYSGAFLGTTGNSELLGQYLCIVMPITAVTGLRSDDRCERLGLLAASLLFLAVLIFSRAEAGYVGVLGCALLCVPLLLPEKKQRRRASVCAVCIAVLGLAVVWFWPGESGTLWEFSRMLHGDIRDEFGSHRIQIWREALALVPERPLLGGGPGTFGERVDIQWSRYIEQIGKTRTSVVSNVHNVYLSYLVNNGVLGLLSYLAAIVCSAAGWLRRRFDKSMAGALGCGVLCCMVQDFFCVTLCGVAPVMWVAWGLLECADSPEAQVGAAPDEILISG